MDTRGINRTSINKSACTLTTKYCLLTYSLTLIKKEVMTMTKITKKEMFGFIKALANGEDVHIAYSDIIEFCDHEIELLDKKKSRGSKPSAKQLENEGFKNDILNILTENDRPMTITEIMIALNDPTLSNQRVSALVTQLKNANLIERIEIKKKAYFSIVD